jgi:flagellar hook-length control protein FliK
MLNEKTIAILGTGNMGEALVSGLIGSGSSTPKNIICTDVRPTKLDEIKSKYKVRTTENNRKAGGEAELVIYAVKPQILAAVLIETAPKLDRSKLVISIAAGVPLTPDAASQRGQRVAMAIAPERVGGLPSEASPVSGVLRPVAQAPRSAGAAAVPDGAESGPSEVSAARIARATPDAVLPQGSAVPEAGARPAVSFEAPVRAAEPAAPVDAPGRSTELSGSSSAAPPARTAAAPLPPPMPGMPLALAQTGWEGGLQERILWVSAHNLRGAEIQLDPPELGPLQIQVSNQREGTSVHFTTHSHLVRDLIEQSLPRLREMLDAGGLRDVNVDVSQQGRGEQRQGNAYPASSRPGSAWADGDAAELQESHLPRVPLGLVDAYV